MKQTIRSAGGSVLGSSSWIFALANCASTACESGFSSSPSRSWRCCSSTPARSSAREELQKKLWPADTFVDFDHGLNKAINKIREALGDSAESPRFVETVARRGYRFLAEVKVAEAAPVREPGTRNSASSRARRSVDRQDVGHARDAHTSSAVTCVEDIGVRAARTAGLSRRLEGSFLATVRRRSFAPWLCFRWRASRAMRLRITSLMG